jgi:hypothetical protein
MAKGGGGGGGIGGGGFAAMAGINLISQAGNIYSSIASQQIERDYQRQQLEIANQMANMAAADAIRRGDKLAAEERVKTRVFVGSQRAALAAQGINIEGGSALDVQRESAEIGAINELTIKNNAWREAFGYRTQAMSLGNQAAYVGIASNFNQKMTAVTGGANFISQTTTDAARFGLFDKKPRRTA